MNLSDALVSSAVGSTHYGGVKYSTTAQTLTGVMAAGTAGVNHGKIPTCDPSQCFVD